MQEVQNILMDRYIVHVYLGSYGIAGIVCRCYNFIVINVLQILNTAYLWSRSLGILKLNLAIYIFSGRIAELCKEDLSIVDFCL